MATDLSDRIGVLLPTHNVARFIGRTLYSILGQTHRNLEVIVIDNDSQDGTPEIVAAIAEQDSRVRLYREPRRGVAAARNLAASRTDAPFLAPCDHDDLWHPEKLALQLAAIRDGGDEVGASYGWTLAIDEKDRVVMSSWTQWNVEGYILHEMIEDNLPGSGSGLMVRRSCFEAVGGYPEECSGADEWQLHIALASRFEFRVVREFLVAYRLHDRNQSSDHRWMESLLNMTAAWARASFPEVPEEVFRKRGIKIYRYLSFTAARQGQVRMAMHYRRRIREIVGKRESPAGALLFGLLCIGGLLGIRRYNERFWIPPRRWKFAPPPGFPLLVALLLVVGAAPSGISAQQSRSDDPRALYADSLYREGEHLASLTYLESVLSAAPDPYPLRILAAREALVLGYVAGRSDEAKRRFAEAIDHGSAALVARPDDTDARYLVLGAKGRLALIEGLPRNLHLGMEVESEALALLSRVPDHAGAHNALGRLYLELASLSFVERLAATPFGGRALISRATWEAAERHLRRATVLDPAKNFHWLDLGHLLALRERDQEARSALETALRIPLEIPAQEGFRREARVWLEDLAPNRP